MNAEVAFWLYYTALSLGVVYALLMVARPQYALAVPAPLWMDRYWRRWCRGVGFAHALGVGSIMGFAVKLGHQSKLGSALSPEVATVLVIVFFGCAHMAYYDPARLLQAPTAIQKQWPTWLGYTGKLTAALSFGCGALCLGLLFDSARYGVLGGGLVAVGLSALWVDGPRRSVAGLILDAAFVISLPAVLWI